jgi:hypothetical protein
MRTPAFGSASSLWRPSGVFGRASCGASDPYLFFLVMGRHAVHDAGSLVAIGCLAHRPKCNLSTRAEAFGILHTIISLCVKHSACELIYVTPGCQYKTRFWVDGYRFQYDTIRAVKLDGSVCLIRFGGILIGEAKLSCQEHKVISVR